jgi:hypothetical protein
LGLVASDLAPEAAADQQRDGLSRATRQVGQQHRQSVVFRDSRSRCAFAASAARKSGAHR